MQVRPIPECLQTVHNLELSIGGIVELTHTVRRELQPEMHTLLWDVRGSAVTHGDETGWRENGQNGYVRGFLGVAPQPVNHFVYLQSRASHIPQGVLGLHFCGQTCAAACWRLG